MLEEYFEEAKHNIANAVHQAVNCFDYDQVVVSGRSGTISLRLVEAAGVPRDKIVHLPRALTRDLYLPGPNPNYSTIIPNWERWLGEKGLVVSDNPRLLLVDEYINGGLKTIGLLKAFEKMSITDFMLTAFTHRGALSDNAIADITGLERIFLPSYPNPLHRRNAHYVMTEIVDRHLSFIGMNYINPRDTEKAVTEGLLAERLITELVRVISSSSGQRS
jgi:hypothetical protein